MSEHIKPVVNKSNPELKESQVKKGIWNAETFSASGQIHSRPTSFLKTLFLGHKHFPATEYVRVKNIHTDHLNRIKQKT